MDTTVPPAQRTESGPVRPAGSLTISQGPPASRRRWVWAAVCALVAILAMLGVVTAVNQVSDRVKVVAVAQDVAAGEKIAAEDLVLAQVAEDPALKPVPAADRDELVGQYAAVALRTGSLLTSSQLEEKNQLTDGKQLVGVEAKRGQLPLKALAPGDSVVVIATPGDGEEEPQKDQDGESPITARVAAISSPDRTGTVVVNLAVSPVDGPVLATRAASGNVALVLEPRS